MISTINNKINKNLIKNKKGQIGFTLTSFFGFMIIVLILFVFITLTIVFVKGGNILSFNKNSIYSYNGVYSESIKFENKNSLLILLNTPIEFEGKKTNVQDALLTTTGPYLNEEFLTKFNINDINELYKYDIYSSQESMMLYGLSKEKDVQRANEIMNSINLQCSDYLLKFPLGYLYKQGDKKSFTKTLTSLSNEYQRKVQDSSSIKIPYRGDIIEIKFYSDESC